MSTEVIDDRLWIILDHVPNYCLVSLSAKMLLAENHDKI
jgi:hypothetical protein